MNIQKELKTIKKDMEKINKLNTIIDNETNEQRKKKIKKMIDYLIRINSIKLSLIIEGELI